MPNSVVIPENYDQWRHCIEVLGKIELTTAYIDERLEVLQDNQNPESKKFTNLYGEEHLRQTIEWFRQAAIDHS